MQEVAKMIRQRALLGMCVREEKWGIQEVCRGRGQEEIVMKSQKSTCQVGSSGELAKQEGKYEKEMELEMILRQAITKSVIEEDGNPARRVF